MTLGEKLSKLRKENNITQEQLAETLGVSRQSVSKWESDLAFPETEKLIRLSAMFQCSLDYLLKEEIQEGTGDLPSAAAVRRVSREDAARLLETRRQTAWAAAIATLLCIISPVCLLLLGAVSEEPGAYLNENTAMGIGMMVLLALVSCAVAVFIFTEKRTGEFESLEKEPFETECGVREWVRNCMEEFRPVYTKYNAAGVCLCILSVVPLFVGMMIREDSDLLMTTMLCLLLGIAGAGVMLIVRVRTVWSGFEQLLQEGEYTQTKKAETSVLRTVSMVYWLLAAAVYLTWGFVIKYTAMADAAAGGWRNASIVWPVAGVLFPAVLAVCKLFIRRN